MFACTCEMSHSADHPDHLILFRKYVSRKTRGNGRAVLEGVGLDSMTIAACFSSHPLDEEGAVQAGLTRWSGGQGHQPPTWEVLISAMEYAEIAQQHIEDLRKDLDPLLIGMLLHSMEVVCVHACVCVCVMEMWCGTYLLNSTYHMLSGCCTYVHILYKVAIWKSFLLVTAGLTTPRRGGKC